MTRTEAERSHLDFGQRLARAVLRSDNLRLPADPERVLTLLQGRLAEINIERERGQG